MFTVTETASARLAEKLNDQNAAGDTVLRFARRRNRWKLSTDTRTAADLAFAHQGKTVLVLDPQAARLLQNRTMDTHDSAPGAKLYLR